MAKKAKGPSIDYFKVGLLVARLILACILIYLGIVILSDAGERTFNKYLHALRKMQLATSKPSDVIAAGMTFDQVNKGLI